MKTITPDYVFQLYAGIKNLQKIKDIIDTVISTLIGLYGQKDAERLSDMHLGRDVRMGTFKTNAYCELNWTIWCDKGAIFILARTTEELVYDSRMGIRATRVEYVPCIYNALPTIIANLGCFGSFEHKLAELETVFERIPYGLSS